MPWWQERLYREQLSGDLAAQALAAQAAPSPEPARTVTPASAEAEQVSHISPSEAGINVVRAKFG